MRLFEQAIMTDTQVEPLPDVLPRFPGVTDLVNGLEVGPGHLYFFRDVKDGSPWTNLDAGSAGLDAAWLSHGASTQLCQIVDLYGIENLVMGVRTTHTPSRWREYVSQRLDRIASGVDRDSDDHSYPTKSIVDEARRVAGRLFSTRTPTPSVVPTEDGGVSFVWHKGGLDVDIEVNDKEVFVCVYLGAFAQSFAGSLNEQIGLVQGVLRYLASLP